MKLTLTRRDFIKSQAVAAAACVAGMSVPGLAQAAPANPAQLTGQISTTMAIWMFCCQNIYSVTMAMGYSPTYLPGLLIATMQYRQCSWITI